MERWIESEAGGSIILDYCCGDGSIAVKEAKAGASLVIGIDLSVISIVDSNNKCNDILVVVDIFGKHLIGCCKAQCFSWAVV